VLITNKHAKTYFFAKNTNGNRIEGTLICKYLGIIVDEKLTWKDHWKQLCCTKKYACVIYKLKHYVNNQALRYVVSQLNKLTSTAWDYSLGKISFMSPTTNIGC